MMKRFLFLIAVAAAGIATGQTNYVMNFNGSNSSVSVGAAAGNGIRSIEFWFKPTVTINAATTIPGWAFIVRNDNGQLKEYGMYIRGSSWSSNIGRLAFFMRDNGTIHEIFSDTTAWVAGTWYHAAGVIDSLNGMRLYINGVLQSSADPTATAAVLSDVNSSYIGVWGSAGVRYFNGRIEEMRLWSRAITQSEIQAKMCQGLNPANETGLQAYWKFDEGSGSQLMDATANAFNGLVNNVTWVSDSPCASPGEYVMEFDGTTSSVDVGPAVSGGVRSIEFWFKPAVTITAATSIAGWALIARDDNQQKEYGMYIRGSSWTTDIGRLSFYVRNNGALHEVFSNANSWNAGTWYHVAGVLDPATGMQLYINGALQASADPSATAAILTDGNDAYIGTWGAAGIRHFNGRIDEMRLWTRAITQSEVQLKMCQSLLASNETGLQAYWKFNEGGGSQLADSTANGNNGVTNNVAWISDSYCASGLGGSLGVVEMHVSPNPTPGILYVTISETGPNTSCQVFNLYGQQVAAARMSGGKQAVDLSALPAGTYILRIAGAPSAGRRIVLSK